jgi:hypothetical protein
MDQMDDKEKHHDRPMDQMDDKEKHHDRPMDQMDDKEKEYDKEKTEGLKEKKAKGNKEKKEKKSASRRRKRRAPRRRRRSLRSLSARRAPMRILVTRGQGLAEDAQKQSALWRPLETKVLTWQTCNVKQISVTSNKSL